MWEVSVKLRLVFWNKYLHWDIWKAEQVQTPAAVFMRHSTQIFEQGSFIVEFDNLTIRWIVELNCFTYIDFDTDTGEGEVFTLMIKFLYLWIWVSLELFAYKVIITNQFFHMTLYTVVKSLKRSRFMLLPECLAENFHWSELNKSQDTNHNLTIFDENFLGNDTHLQFWVTIVKFFGLNDHCIAILISRASLFAINLFAMSNFASNLLIVMHFQASKNWPGLQN